MKKTEKSVDGTSFHDVTITTTINELTRVLGEPTYTGDFSEEKVTVEWICETKEGKVVTIYDWKEYRSIGKDEKIQFHLGGHSKMHTLDAKDELRELLNK
jgi:hypothetical protein